jgi:hypothetical protein
VIAAPEAFERRRCVWQSEPHGLDLRSALPFVDNELEKVRAAAEQRLCDPVQWASLHYPTLVDRAVRGSGVCRIARDGVAHGLAVWFDTELVEGVGASNAPGAPDGIYGQLFFAWPEAMELNVGDRVAFELRADPVGSDYVWTWASEIQRPSRGPAALTRFRQSSFKSLPPGPESIRRRAPTSAPALTPTGTIALEVLEGMRGGRTIGELARQLQTAHPERFPSLDEAHGFAAELAERYGA